MSRQPPVLLRKRMREPLVLVPWLLCTARLFAPQVAAFGTEREVIVADHSCGTTFAEIATTILATAPPRFALGGLSMGGGIGLQMVAQAPHRISRLAILDSSPLPDEPAISTQRRRLIAMAERGEFSAAAAQLAPSFLGTTHGGNAVLRATLATMAEETGAATFIRHEQAQIARPDARPLLAEIRCATLVLVGIEDRLTPPALSIDMATAIPRADLRVLPACGHLSTLEAPAAVNEALALWLGAGC